jgi:hypothetical protein
MIRSIIIAVLLSLAVGCAATPVAVKVTASSSGRTTSEELDCMSECLDSDDEDCASCVAQCLKPVSEAVPPLASLK